MNDIADILDKAADLIEPPGKWAQGHAAYDASHEPVAALNPRAVCWCAWGALVRVTGDETGDSDEALEVLCEVTGMVGFDPAEFGERWNDAPERTQDEVVATLREAAAKAREQQP